MRLKDHLIDLMESGRPLTLEKRYQPITTHQRQAVRPLVTTNSQKGKQPPVSAARK